MPFKISPVGLILNVMVIPMASQEFTHIALGPKSTNVSRPEPLRKMAMPLAFWDFIGQAAPAVEFLSTFPTDLSLLKAALIEAVSAKTQAPLAAPNWSTDQTHPVQPVHASCHSTIHLNSKADKNIAVVLTLKHTAWGSKHAFDWMMALVPRNISEHQSARNGCLLKLEVVLKEANTTPSLSSPS